MKILYASERPPYPFFQGGAARSAHYLMSILAKDLAVECFSVGSKQFASSQWSSPAPEEFAALGISKIETTSERVSIRCGYNVEVVNDFEETLLKIIDDRNPDVIWTQLDGAETVSRIAREKGKKVLAYLRDAEDSPAMLKSLARLGCCIVCNSRFMAQRVKKLTGKSARVIYPSLEESFGVSGDPLGYITMINPFRVKGIDTFLEIAKRMPSENFLLVESWTLDAKGLAALQGRLANLPNVRFLHRVPDVQEIYRQAKLVLVPSVWEEAFGRVVIEAQSCRIPVIASRRGGLPEAVGEGGICVRDYLNADAWVAEIQRVLSDPITYRALAGLAHDHATGHKFSTQHAARQFLEICNDRSLFGATTSSGLRTWFSRLRNIARGD